MKRKDGFLKDIRSGISILVLILCCLLGSCVSMAPVNLGFDSAKTLKKGQLEFAGNYAQYSLRGETEGTNGPEEVNEKVNTNLGFRAGYGISNRFDLKFRYERLRPLLEEDLMETNGVNYFTLSPRFAIIPDYLSTSVDIGLYTYSVEDEYNDQIFYFSPKIQLSIPVKQYLDISLGLKLDVFPSESATYLGTTLGIGVSTNTDRWAFRPEIGLMKDIEDFSSGSWKSWGCALVYRFNTGKNK